LFYNRTEKSSSFGTQNPQNCPLDGEGKKVPRNGGLEMPDTNCLARHQIRKYHQKYKPAVRTRYCSDTKLMGETMMITLFEKNGGTHSDVGDYHIPNLTVPEQPEYEIGVWGRRRLNYLKKQKRVLYINLFTSGKLYEHLHEIDTAAYERSELIIKQVMAAEGVTEQLKAENPMSRLL
jgi:hypothetical protein